MTNLELAQQQGNQAAPNLLAAATAGELGGGSSMFPSLSTAGAVAANMRFSLDTDQADEAAANTIYNNCKLVTDNHLDFFILIEDYLADGSELPTLVSMYFAFSARILTRIKNLVALMPEFPAEIFDNIEPDELCTFENEIASGIGELVLFALGLGVDELPASASGLITLTFTAMPDKLDKLLAELIPEDSLAYFQFAPFAPFDGTPPANGLLSVQYYAESLLDTPVKLDKVYSIYPAQNPAQEELP